MTTKVSVTLHLAGTALVLWLAAATPGSAQSSDPSVRTVQSTQGTASRPVRKPAKPGPRVASPSPAEKPWTIENALPDHSASMRQYDSPPSQPKIGRVPLQSGPGTVGVETETKTNAYKTPDGRTIPGLEATADKSNTYLGLSLSVPTSDKSMPLVPLLPAWGRP